MGHWFSAVLSKIDIQSCQELSHFLRPTDVRIFLFPLPLSSASSSSPSSSFSPLPLPLVLLLIDVLLVGGLCDDGY